MIERPSVQLALAAITACVSSVALYALLRVVQKLLFAEPDPALVIYSAHAGFFWRAWTAAYGGGMVGFIAYLGARKSPARAARVLATALLVAIALVVTQGVLVP
jgi:hypothetical protein